MTNQNLELIRGDDTFYYLTFTDENDQAINITGWKIYFTAKTNVTDTDENAVIKKDVIDPHEDPLHGIGVIHLTTTETSVAIGKYFYDIQIKKSTGEIFTLLAGELRVNQDITTRTT